MKLKKLIIAGMLTLVISGLAYAEATKEITRDAGLYAGSPVGTNPTNVFSWSFSSINLDLEHQNEPGTPEGVKSARAIVNLQWGGWGIFNVTQFGGSTIVAKDYSAYDGGAIRFWLKSNDPLDVEVEYQQLSVPAKSKIVVQSTNGNWKEIVLPLSTFLPPINAARLAAIRAPFQITAQPAGASKTWFVDHVRWTKPLASLELFPPSTQVNPGKKRQFTVEGRDAAGEYVVVYSQFSAPGSVGTTVPSGTDRAVQAIFTANSSDGNITATVQNTGENLTDTSAIDVTNADLSARLGILSETVVPGLDLDNFSPNQNGALALFGTNPGKYPVVSDDFTDPQEGTFSVKTVFPTLTAQQFSGWAVQWGDFNTDDSHTRDMSAFYDGSIRFWFKAPATLQNKIVMGIRSGNVPASQELSNALLSSFGVPFDGTWHPVSIPLKDWAKARPYADLSRTKIFAVFSVVGALSGSESNRTFYIDNLRWDTSLPGVLSRIEVTPNGIPNPVPIPPGFSRVFTATGYDASGAQVDISPSWDFVGPSLGTLNPTTGRTTVLTAGITPQTGTLRARMGSISGTAAVSIENVVFTQTFNIYSDAGVGGDIGVSTGPAVVTNTQMQLTELTGTPPEGTKFMRANFTLQNSPAGNDAFAVWFVETPDFPRFMRDYENGFLRFHVKTDENLEISIRSANIDPNSNNAKINLLDLGVPLNNQWQQVIIPLALFKARDPRLDFNQISTFFVIGGVSDVVGQLVNENFDVDDVKWLATDSTVPDPLKILQGLRDKQQPSGLLRSFASNRAVTYDMALAAMAFTYNKDFTRTRNIFNAFQSVFVPGQGFADEYNSEVSPPTVLNGDRTVGPNSFLLLALMHYKNASRDNTYNAIINDLAAWILGFQDADGAIKFGNPIGVIPPGTKSTEHNFDAYAAFKAYAKFSGNNQYNIEAAQVLNWLETEAWNAGQGRFNVGERFNGTPDTGKALDAYSWAPLALNDDSSLPIPSVLPLAETDFAASFNNGTTGLLINGVDFGGPNPNPDRDAVWLEGMGQMALAYLSVGNETKANSFINELNKAVFVTGPAAQGITYATNEGTGYGGFTMNATDPSVSAMAWYLFAVNNFNPFNPFPIFGVQIRNISNNQPATEFSWNVNIPVASGSEWKLSDQYIKLEVQNITDEQWGLQIYTNNADPAAQPRFVDPTPNPNDAGSDPAGLLYDNAGAPTGMTLPLAWSIKDLVTQVPTPADPNNAANPDSFQWFFFKDRNTPNIDLNNNGTFGDPGEPTQFVDGEDFITVRMNQNGTGASHFVQGDPGQGYFPTMSPEYLFLQANFFNAGAQSTYRTNTITFEFFVD